MLYTPALIMSKFLKLAWIDDAASLAGRKTASGSIPTPREERAAWLLERAVTRVSRALDVARECA